MSGLDVRQDGKTTIFTIYRPGRRNALNNELALAIREAFAEFEASDQKVLIITGGGNNFCGGVDLDDHTILWKVLPTLGLRTEKPVIAAIHGWCVGGAMLFAALSDLCVASETSRFHYPEARIGLTGGIITTLAGRIPHKFAMEIMLLGREVSAQRAYEMGLVNQVVPAGQQLEAALEIARDLETMAPLVLHTLKRFVTESVLPQSPSERMARAQRDLLRVSESADLAEGLASVREDRAPVFTGE